MRSVTRLLNALSTSTLWSISAIAHAQTNSIERLNPEKVCHADHTTYCSSRVALHPQWNPGAGFAKTANSMRFSLSSTSIPRLLPRPHTRPATSPPRGVARGGAYCFGGGGKGSRTGSGLILAFGVWMPATGDPRQVPRQKSELLVYGRDGEITSGDSHEDEPRPAKN